MLAVYRNPFTGHYSCCKPQPEPEKVTYDRIQIQGIVGLVPMQENCDAGDGYVG
jgi:hypothetical protein